jgi:eukaryotic-like serine/threonine-protein kinase
MKTISRYEISEPIGSRAMSQVYLAYDPVIKRKVVVKSMNRTELLASDRVETIDRFKRQALAAGRLTHPNIIAVYEYGEAGPISFIAMEHASGQTLRSYLADNPLPELGAVLNIVRQLFAALVYAHEQGVLHRDLKPRNVILIGNPLDRASLQVKVLDFGITHVTTATELAHIGPVLGTPGYMSPEQYLGHPIDGRTDIYALGVMLFQMLTGKRMFKGTTSEVRQQVIQQDAPLVSAVRKSLPPGLDAVIAKTLERDPGKRFNNMRELREAFVAALAPKQPDTYAVIFHPDEPAVAPVQHASSPVARPLPSQAQTVAQCSSAAEPLVAPEARQLSVMAQSISLLVNQRAGAAQAKPSILFLDDEERILGALSALFRLKYEVFISTNGEEALEIVKSRQPNVIVSDQRMPHMLGIDFLRQAREIDPSSVRILLTGYSDLVAIVGSINDGEVFRFVNKPWSNQEIKSIIAEAVDISLMTKQASLAVSEPTLVSEAHRASDAILIAEATHEIFELINDDFGRTHPVCHAVDVASVLQTIEDQEVAVLVCDIDGFDGASVMLKMLKQSHPQIQTVVISASSDSSGLIGLINQAQIFRFFNRPLRLGLISRGLRSALDVYARVKARPVLAQRQKVQAKPEVAQSSIGHQILQRLSFLIRPKST